MLTDGKHKEEACLQGAASSQVAAGCLALASD